MKTPFLIWGISRILTNFIDFIEILKNPYFWDFLKTMDFQGFNGNAGLSKTMILAWDRKFGILANLGFWAIIVMDGRTPLLGVTIFLPQIHVYLPKSGGVRLCILGDTTFFRPPPFSVCIRLRLDGDLKIP